LRTLPVIGLPVAATDYAGAVEWILARAAARDRPWAVEAANTHVAALSRRDPAFAAAIAAFDLICPDGMPLIWVLNAAVPKSERLRDRVYGPTLMLETLRATASRGGQFSHFLLGGKPSTLDRLRERFAGELPGVHFAGTYSPPFGDWPADESDRIRRQIAASGANLVWVGLGCPKQELWIARHKEQLPPAVYFGIGAAFAFHAGEVAQAPPALQRLGLEWAYRIYREPRRLFRRYFIYNSLFIWYAVRDKLR
jgi:N-acetylglucosaminyldiphosphoundecaprenol N-acetyl-beta-D-mannosaminyltransferase